MPEMQVSTHASSTLIKLGQTWVTIWVSDDDPVSTLTGTRKIMMCRNKFLYDYEMQEVSVG